MTVWRWSSFVQAPATRLPLLTFIVILGTLQLGALLAITPADLPRAQKQQLDAERLGQTSLQGGHKPKQR
jgi:hypothetical protein